MARRLVCIPTYNEASNILALIERVHEASPETEVLVIDVADSKSIAAAAAAMGVPVVHLSTDYVFRGDKHVQESFQ